jgi:hypothetical protein
MTASLALTLPLVRGETILPVYVHEVAMPVNMDPNNRRRKAKATPQDGAETVPTHTIESKEFGKETETDRQKALAEAESKNLWDATEVIDMDKW